MLVWGGGLIYTPQTSRAAPSSEFWKRKRPKTQCYCKLFDVEVLSLGALSEVILSSHQSHCITPSPYLHGLHKGPLETCRESTLQTTSPRSSMNCPCNIVRSHYTSFRVRGTSVLAAPFTPSLCTPQHPYEWLCIWDTVRASKERWNALCYFVCTLWLSPTLIIWVKILATNWVTYVWSLRCMGMAGTYCTHQHNHCLSAGHRAA